MLKKKKRSKIRSTGAAKSRRQRLPNVNPTGKPYNKMSTKPCYYYFFKVSYKETGHKET